MSDTYNLTGSFTSTPDASSGSSTDATPLAETVTLAKKQGSAIDLTVDTGVSLPFGGVTNAHIIFLYASNKITAKITTADGTEQIVPVDPMLQLIALSSPATAIKLVRTAGTATTVQYFLGEKA